MNVWHWTAVVIKSAPTLWDPSNAPASQDSLWRPIQRHAMSSMSASSTMEDVRNCATILMAHMNVDAERAFILVRTRKAALMWMNVRWKMVAVSKHAPILPVPMFAAAMLLWDMWWILEMTTNVHISVNQVTFMLPILLTVRLSSTVSSLAQCTRERYWEIVLQAHCLTQKSKCVIGQGASSVLVRKVFHQSTNLVLCDWPVNAKCA